MPAWPLRFQLAEQRLSLPRTAHPDEANMTILRILHVGQIASAILPPGFQRPEDNGFPAAERTAKALAVARARPQLLMPPRPARRPPHRLAQRAPEAIVVPACAPGAGPEWICLSRWCRPR